MISSLEQKGGIKILLYLAEHGKTGSTELLHQLHAQKVGQRAYYTALNRLLKVGLIKEERSGDSYTRDLSVTDTGQNVAMHLREIIKIIQGN
jgi:Fe2+ or Zn2+ uptake regulation protein